MERFWKDKKVFVTGGAGFIGSHVVDSLVANGAHVTIAVSKNTTEDKIDRNLKAVKDVIQIKQIDLLDEKDCIQTIGGYEVILHFAAVDGGLQFKKQHPAEIFSCNTKMVLNVLDAAQKNGVSKTLLMSSIDVYGKSDEKVLTEDMGFAALPHTSIEGYAWAKRFAEIAGSMYINQYGMQVTIVRAGNVYGPRDYAEGEKERVIPSFISKAMRGEDIIIFGTGDQEKSFLFVTDFAKAVLDSIAVYTQSEPINIVGTHQISLNELARKINELCGGKSSIIHKESLSPTINKIISIKKAEDAIHFVEQVMLDEGLRKTISYFEDTVNEKK